MLLTNRIGRELKLALVAFPVKGAQAASIHAGRGRCLEPFELRVAHRCDQCRDIADAGILRGDVISSLLQTGHIDLPRFGLRCLLIRRQNRGRGVNRCDDRFPDMRAVCRGTTSAAPR